MKDWTVHLVRHHALQYVNRLRIYISSLPDSEPQVYEKLAGPEGVKTAARIVDHILTELGHEPPMGEGKSYEERPSVKVARQVIGNGKR